MNEYLYAQIDANRMVVSVTQVHSSIEAPHMIAIPAMDESLIGKLHNEATGQFEAVLTVQTPDPRIWWIDVGPFKDRLGMDAMAIYSSTHDACKGVVGMVEGRKYFDLKDPRIAGMINVLIATQQPTANAVWPGSGPMTAEKRDVILNTPTTEQERHIKGLQV
ncbi:MAG: hypothetical protein WAW34_09460 [Rhodoferax sp.]